MATMFANIMLRTTCDRLDRPSSYTVAKARLLLPQAPLLASH
jgi:nuclear cap-binding protein subunit 2